MAELGTLVAKIAADITDLKSGLKQGQAELAGFKDLAMRAGDSIKGALAFTGITAGLLGVIAKLREFGASAMEAGKSLEVLRLSMYQVGQHYGLSAESLNLYISQLRQMGILQENAVKSINAFMKTGVSIDYLPQLAQAAKDLGPSMAMSSNEAFEAIVQSIATGMPRALRTIIPGIQQVMQASASETKKLMDESVLSVSDRAQIMADYVLQFAERVKGVGAATADSYVSQLAKYKRAVAEAKEAMFELYKPIAVAVLGQQIQNWQQFYEAINNNREAIKQFGEAIAVLVGGMTTTIRTVVEFIATHKDLTLAILSVYSASKLLAKFAITTGALEAAVAVGGLTAKLAILRAMIASPWTLVIIASLIGMDYVAKQLKALNAPLQQKLREEKGAMMIAPGQTDLKTREATPEEEKAMGALPVDTKQSEALQAQAKAQADQAAAIAKAENALPQTSGGGKGGGKGKAAQEEDLFGEYLRVLEAERQVEIQNATASVDLLKATNDQKRAELEKSLADGTLDGQQYYAGLQKLAQDETAATLKLIDVKRDAAKKANADALADIARQDGSAEMQDYKRQEEMARFRVAMSQLDAEAAKTKLDNEVKVTNELKRQVESGQQFKRQVEDLELASAWGPVEEQEARVRRLYLEWQRAKEEAIKAGASPEILAKMDISYQKQLDIAPVSDQLKSLADDIANGFTSIFDSIIDGGQELRKTANSIFKSIFNDALKPGLDQLKQLLMNGFKSLFGEVGGAVGSAIMGVIGLVGMLLTKGGSSSFSASGATSSVTSSEKVRGIIAGESSVAVADIADDLAEALVDTNDYLRQIADNTSGMSAGAASTTTISGSASINVNVSGLDEELAQSIKESLENYFRDYLMTGATA